MTKPVIGLIGLGFMGSNRIECLQKNGFELNVMDLHKDAVAAVVARGGATELTSPAELASASEIVMLCLTLASSSLNLVHWHSTP